MFSVAASTEETRSANVRFGEGTMKVDEDQQASFEKIIQLLISGGYFRAMITTLDPFDKVAGGLAWCITAASENVNMGLLLDEHSRMGEKLEMAENIEAALTQMRCPRPLQAQQILHLDCINIFPVVQWLVDHLIEVRQATGDVVRQYSEKQFRNMDYLLPEDEAKELAKPKATEYLQSCEDRYTIKREHRMKKRSRYLRTSRMGKEF